MDYQSPYFQLKFPLDPQSRLTDSPSRPKGPTRPTRPTYKTHKTHKTHKINGPTRPTTPTGPAGPSKPISITRPAKPIRHTGPLKTHPPGGGWKIFGNFCPRTTAGSLDCQMSNTLALGQTRNLRSRSISSGWEEVAGSGVGEVSEERGEGTQPRHRLSLEVISDWDCQAILVDSSNSINNLYTRFSALMQSFQCFTTIIPALME